MIRSFSNAKGHPHKSEMTFFILMIRDDAFDNAMRPQIIQKIYLSFAKCGCLIVLYPSTANSKESTMSKVPMIACE